MASRMNVFRQQTSARIDPHEHGWRVESRHPASAGWVLYVRCPDCGTRRVDLQERADAPPTAISDEVQLRPARER